MNKKLIIFCLLIVVVGTSACFAANAEKMDFGDFTLEIDGVPLFNDTQDGTTVYVYLLNNISGNSSEFIVTCGSASNSQETVIDNCLSQGYEKLEEDNGFVLFSSGTSDSKYKYTAVHVTDGGTGILISFDDLDAGKKIINTYEDA
jgi:hypothetical protein